jgi:ribosomal protein S18 acetylase RimI-like enzyme
LIEILPLQQEQLPAAAALWTAHFRELRRKVPSLPPAMEEEDCLVPRLGKLAQSGHGLAAWRGGELVGYLGWFVVEKFRAADRRAGYVPEWAHAVKDSSPAITRALYREAAFRWAAEGCNTHAISLLAHDTRSLDTWVWNGFGLSVVDAIRSLDPLGAPVAAGFRLRPAGPADVDPLAALEAEHFRHYSAPPILMETRAPDDAPAFSQFLSKPDCGAWLAETGQEAVGYLRFESRSFGAAAIVRDPGTVAITGAYVRPAQRGNGVAAALLDAALRDFKDQGYQRCSVDFESFNPEAAQFWCRYFEPVSLSLIRVPEYIPR